MIKHVTTWSLLLFVCLLGFTGCDDDDNVNPPATIFGDLADLIEDDDRFTTLRGALDQTGLLTVLGDVSNPRTVFAPTDAAFTAAGVDLGSLSNEQLTDILLYHVVAGRVPAATLDAGQSQVPSLSTGGVDDRALTLAVNRNGTNVTINGNANVIDADNEAVNGIVHVIDQVLLPPSIASFAVADGRFTTLVSALQRVGLVDVLTDAGTYTVFAPTDDAFAAAGINLADLSDDDLRDILLYHVLGATAGAGDLADGNSFVTTLSASGPNGTALSALVDKSDDVVSVNGDATVVIADISTTNGVIHAIDKVLLPQNIVDFATKADGTSELANAVVAAGLVDALSAAGPLTVFAPVNSAFEAISSTVAGLTDAQLVDVLTYHVVSGNVRSDDLSAGMVNSLNDDNDIEIMEMEDGTFFIRNGNEQASFILTDIQASNGVIHLIDQVLIPSS